MLFMKAKRERGEQSDRRKEKEREQNSSRTFFRVRRHPDPGRGKVIIDELILHIDGIMRRG